MLPKVGMPAGTPSWILILEEASGARNLSHQLLSTIIMMIITEVTIIHTVIQTHLEGMGIIEDTLTIMITPLIMITPETVMMEITGTVTTRTPTVAIMITPHIVSNIIPDMILHHAVEEWCTLKEESVLHSTHTMIHIIPRDLPQITTLII